MKAISVLGIDLGAKSGRVMAVHLNDNGLELSSVHRFLNRPIMIRNTLHWNILQLWQDIQDGIDKAKDLSSASIGVDTWGVDFALLDNHDQLLGIPVHYRDHRTDGIMEKAFRKVSREEIFQQTGIQFMPINTIDQLYSMVLNGSASLRLAHTFLTIPDLLNFWLTGVKTCEFTNATTTQLYNPTVGNWAKPVLDKLAISETIFPSITLPGTRLGKYHGIPVIAPACHDTGSAVAAIPAKNPDYAYISSGTWSLVGIEIENPIISPEALEANLTNEGGVENTFRLLKNVMGLWIFQQCRNTFTKKGKLLSYQQLMALASQALPLQHFINPNDLMFLPPGDHPQLIQSFCKETGQSIPENEGAIIRCVLESLAFSYRKVLTDILQISGREVNIIHIVGGGSKNVLLCQMTANVTHLPVVAGPDEATVLGNALTQLIALGEISNIHEARQLIAKMGVLKHYFSHDHDQWDKAYERFLKIIAKHK